MYHQEEQAVAEGQQGKQEASLGQVYTLLQKWKPLDTKQAKQDSLEGGVGDHV